MRTRDPSPSRFVCPEGHAVLVRGADHLVGLYCEDHETMMRHETNGQPPEQPPGGAEMG